MLRLLERSGGGLGWTFAKLTVVLLALTAPVGAAYSQDDGSPAAGPSGLAMMAAMEEVLVDVIERCEQSVVSVVRVRIDESDPDSRREGRFPFRDSVEGEVNTAENPTNPEFIPNEYGTGVIVDSEGLILTNYHVLFRSEEERINYQKQVNGERTPYRLEFWVTTVDKQPYLVQNVTADQRIDLAVLKIDASRLKAMTLGDADPGKLRKGQIVIALGNPYQIVSDGQASASWGIISNVARKAGPSSAEEFGPDRKPTLHHFGTLIQTDAKLNFGASGGALVNLKGEMIGLTTSAAALSGYEQAAGYALPVNEAFRRAVEDMKEGREVEYGFLGIMPVNLRSDEIESGKRGVRVGATEIGTPASSEPFPLEDGDIITAIDGVPIGDVDDLMLYVGSRNVETQCRLTVDRRDPAMPKTKQVRLAKYGVRGRHIVTNPRAAWRGMRVDYATVLFTSDWFRLNRSWMTQVMQDGCIVVVDVEKDSPAEKAGFRPNDIITQVGRRRVLTPREFERYADASEGDVEVQVAVGEAGRGWPSSADFERRTVAAP